MKNFQAFNGLQELTWGDEIRVTSGDTAYVYQVDRVYKASATNGSAGHSWASQIDFFGDM
ncbi:MAG: hypothetical protein R3B69_02060 [Candidatus Paceibacterota bacterium]